MDYLNTEPAIKYIILNIRQQTTKAVTKTYGLATALNYFRVEKPLIKVLFFSL